MFEKITKVMGVLKDKDKRGVTRSDYGLLKCTDIELKIKPRIINRLAVMCLLGMLLVGCTSTNTVVAQKSTVNNNVSNSGTTCDEPNYSSEVIVPILMFHDVKTAEGGTWSMSAENFRNTLVFLLENGYTPISFEQLVDYVDGIVGVPEKPVCITLDDGYFSNYRNVLPIITELNVPITVFMTCKTVRGEGIIPSSDESVLYKMSAAELKIMEASPLVHIQSHTYGLHGVNTSYSDIERDSSLPLGTESESEFKEIFAKDCELAENVLSNIGCDKCFVLSYPNGKYHEWTEEVLRMRKYRVSVTTDYSHVNLVVRGDPESLYLLGRLNVNDETSESQLLQYLERK